MIKSLVIVVLLLLVIGGAALSRPTEESFKAYYRELPARQNQGLLDKLLQESRVTDYLSKTTYRNRVLWADIEHDGKIAYTGAFSRWFPRNSEKAQPAS